MLRTAQASILIVNVRETAERESSRGGSAFRRAGEGVGGRKAVLPSACASVTFLGMKEEERVVAVPARW